MPVLIMSRSVTLTCVVSYFTSALHRITMTSKKRRRGTVKTTDDKLIAALESAITSQGSAELAILHLFNSYDFHLADLQLLLQGSYFSLKCIYSEPILVWDF